MKKKKPSTRSNPETGVIYVGRTDGEMPLIIGKVGHVQADDSLRGRIKSLKAADRIFKFVAEAAFEVTPRPGRSIHSVEKFVHRSLAGTGRLFEGENFLAPDQSLTLLAREVECALKDYGEAYRVLDVSALRAEAEAYNLKMWDKLRGRRTATEACPYEAWLHRERELFQGINWGRPATEDVRSAMAMGYLLRDLAAGSGLSQLDLKLPMGGKLMVFPSTLEAALFEAKAEVDLELPTTTRFQARPKTGDEVGHPPLAMDMIFEAGLEIVRVPNTFLPTADPAGSGVKFTPDHLAALGYLGGNYGGECRFAGLGVRARIPAHLFAGVRAYPDQLPGIRFWLGLMHAFSLGIRVQDYVLPPACGALWERLSPAALILEKAGMALPLELQSWVAHAWFPAAEADLAGALE